MILFSQRELLSIYYPLEIMKNALCGTLIYKERLFEGIQNY